MDIRMADIAACGAALALLAEPGIAHASLPQPVKDIINAAIATGNAKKVKTVVELAKQTNPDDAAEIDAMYQAFQAKQEQMAEAKEAKREERIRSAGLFGDWSGKGQIGASRSTGNTSSIGLTLGLTLDRNGIDWTHELKALVDYQRTAGTTTQEHYLFSYEPNYKFSDRLFAFGLGQYERNRFQGFASRISVSAGLGYQVIKRKHLHLSFKGGPAWRWTDLVPYGHQSRPSGLGAVKFDWKPAKRLKLSEEASVYLEAGNSTFDSTTAFEAKLNGNLTARLSYVVDYDTNPPADAVRTDTLSRVTLLFGF